MAKNTNSDAVGGIPPIDGNDASDGLSVTLDPVSAPKPSAAISRRDNLLQQLATIESLTLAPHETLFIARRDWGSGTSPIDLRLDARRRHLTFGKSGVPAKKDLSTNALHLVVEGLRMGSLQAGVRELPDNAPRKLQDVVDGRDPVIASGEAVGSLLSILGRDPKRPLDEHETLEKIARYSTNRGVLVALRYLESYAATPRAVVMNAIDGMIYDLTDKA